MQGNGQLQCRTIKIGGEDTAARYMASWDSKAVSNGNHTLSATARSVNGQTAATSITVNAQNVAQPPPTPTEPPLVKLVKTIVKIVVKIVNAIISLFRR